MAESEENLRQYIICVSPIEIYISEDSKLVNQRILGCITLVESRDRLTEGS